MKVFLYFPLENAVELLIKFHILAAPWRRISVEKRCSHRA
jgi:hypothetical protein